MAEHTPASQRDRGFTLVELLTVAIVLGILTAVSTPIFLRHRNNAALDSVRKDAEQAGLALTAQVTGSGTLPASLDSQGSAAWGFQPSSPDNRLVEYKVAEDRFRICILNTAATPNAWAIYTSADGKVTSGTGTEPTGACDGDTTAPELAAEPTRGPSTPIPTPTPTAVPTVTPPDGYKCHTFTSSAGATADKQNLSWSDVANANGYRIKAYRDGVLQTTDIVTGTSTVADDPAPYTWQWTVDARGPGFTNSPCAAPVYTPPPVAPAGVTVATVPGESRGTVSWAGVSGATAYRVYLDGATIPAWTGAATTAVVNDLTNGSHTVTVSAQSGSTEGAQSSARSFTAVNNNAYADAAAVPVLGAAETYTSVNFSNATASAQSGEAPYSDRSLWWTFRVAKSRAYTFSVLSPTDGTARIASPRVTVYSGSTSLPTSNPSAYDPVTVGWTGALGATNQTDMTVGLTDGAYIAVRVSTDDTSAAGAGKFRLRVAAAPYYDHSSDAAVLTAPTSAQSTTSGVYDNTLAGRELYEEGTSRASLWFKFIAPESGRMSAGVVSSSGTAPTEVSMTTGANGWPSDKKTGTDASMSVTAGQTYWVRVAVAPTASNLDARGQFRVRLTAADCFTAYPYDSTGIRWKAWPYATEYRVSGEINGAWFTTTLGPGTTSYSRSLGPSDYLFVQAIGPDLHAYGSGECR